MFILLNLSVTFKKKTLFPFASCVLLPHSLACVRHSWHKNEKATNAQCVRHHVPEEVAGVRSCRSRALRRSGSDSTANMLRQSLSLLKQLGSATKWVVFQLLSCSVCSAEGSVLKLKWTASLWFYVLECFKPDFQDVWKSGAPINQ